MYLYLIRHGIAVDLDALDSDSSSNDEFRPLTKQGRKKMAQVADRLDEFGLKFDLIMTSPLVRARQTADIAIAAQMSTQLEISSDLAPSGNLPCLDRSLEFTRYRQTDRFARFSRTRTQFKCMGGVIHIWEDSRSIHPEKRWDYRSEICGRSDCDRCGATLLLDPA